MRSLRWTLLTAVVSAGAVLVPTVAGASPGAPSAQPTVESVQKQLGRLALKNSQLVEQYDQARVLAAKRQAEAMRAKAAAARAERAFAIASMQTRRTLVAQYEGTSEISAASALLTSTDGQALLDKIDTLSLLTRHESQVVDELTAVQAQATSASATATKLFQQAKTQLAAVQKTRSQVQNQIAKYKATLNMLTAAQRSAFSRSINPSVQVAAVNTAGASAAAQTAVRFALAQVGKPYVFGAAGPDAYDCSGLTMASWAAAGVSLPHSAADQYNYGTHVPLSQLSPGDLIFMYSPIGHVTIYIGNGLMVSAPQEGENVSVVSVSSFASDIVGATHLR